MTIPTVVSGRDFQIQPGVGAQRHAIAVRSDSKGLVLVGIARQTQLSRTERLTLCRSKY